VKVLVDVRRCVSWLREGVWFRPNGVRGRPSGLKAAPRCGGGSRLDCRLQADDEKESEGQLRGQSSAGFFDFGAAMVLAWADQLALGAEDCGSSAQNARRGGRRTALARWIPRQEEAKVVGTGTAGGWRRPGKRTRVCEMRGV